MPPPGPGGDGGTAAAAGLAATSAFNPTTILNSTIAANVSRISGATGTVIGGGAYLGAIEPGALTVLGSTIAGNSVEGGAASGGGNLYITDNVGVRDSIVANGAGPPGRRTAPGSGRNRSASTSTASTSATSTRRATGSTRTRYWGRCRQTAARPQTMLPAPTSPVVDQGIAVRPTDQRGVVRPIDFPSIANAPGGDGSDIGAVELQPLNALRSASSRRTRRRGRRR